LQPRLRAADIFCPRHRRKSTEEGLEKEFNSLDAQRATAEAYIASQQHEGWLCLPRRYDDGGYSGGNLERPALQRLLADLAAGHIDCVLVHKVDRLSRSLLDFARIMERFDEHQVAFVSVTQQFCTATSVGRLILNVLLSFAQFERELIAERTRDKIAATRRQGKWVGGLPLLGYDLDPRTAKLRLNEAETARVRAIFALYLERQALGPVVRELERRGWRTKRWRTRQGRERGGKRFTRNHLRQLLSNVLYTGQIRYRHEVRPGEHPAIVDATTWQQAQTLLRHHRPAQGQRPARSGAWLQGLLRCAACGTGMTPSQSTRGTRQYRYYVCLGAQKRGWHTCPAPSVPAEQVEHLVIEQLQGLENAPANFRSLFEALESAERCRLVRLVLERVDYHASQDKLTVTLVPGGPLARVAGHRARLRRCHRRTPGHR
jgi:site-specific DNA recombinase